MYFHKIPTPYNFSYKAKPGDMSPEFAFEPLGSDLFRLSVEDTSRWPQGNPSIANLDIAWAKGGDNRWDVNWDHDGLKARFDGVTRLSSLSSMSFGLNGSQWMLCFPHNPSMKFYGMGEKKGFERSRIKTQFWNTDVMADFAQSSIETGDTDPMYASLPQLIFSLPNGSGTPLYGGILINNPDAVFMNTAAEEGIFAFQKISPDPLWYCGSVAWKPEVYFAFGDSLAQVTRNFQRLQGTTPLPPLWALGHHQCRWGYSSGSDLEAIARGYEDHGIPNDGLWLDIDYMRGYRVFTVDEERFPQVEQMCSDLADRGFSVVPILDPGVKRDPEWELYQEAKAKDLFCKTGEGQDFVGFVWPGITNFPDFSVHKARRWWRDHVALLSQKGFAGYWIDMNDPSTGSVPLEDMRFAHGTMDHGSFHNQYALAMAMGTREGLIQARPDQRPLVVSRSAYLSMAGQAALWTGDNLSNVHHMAASIGISLSLGLSGLPFNGPDVPGFGGDATPDLMETWYKLGFLFPFLRNHSVKGTVNQEPWAFGPSTTAVVRSYIQLRYQLMPYLYNLFIDQEEKGDPILRPMVYHYEGQGYEDCDTQFTVGSSLLQAPQMDLDSRLRSVDLPNGCWFAVDQGHWLEGGTYPTSTHGPGTPLFVNAGSVVPMVPGPVVKAQRDLSQVDLFLAWHGEWHGNSQYRYRWDDGISFDYRQGKRSSLVCTLSTDPYTTSPRLTIETESEAYGPGSVRLVIPGKVRTIGVQWDGATRDFALEPCLYPWGPMVLEASVSPLLTREDMGEVD